MFINSFHSGDVIYFRNLRDHLVVLNSAQAANDLLEKQARVSSDRPFGNMMDKPYDETWRQSRRAFHQNFRSEAMVKYEPVQMEKVHEFIRALSLSPNPEQLWSDISTFSQGIMFSSIYGLNIVSKEILPKAARLAADQIDWNLLPGNVSFKRLPFIHLVLSLMPNCQLSRHQKKIRETIDQLRERPFKAAMEAWVCKSDSHPSMVGELMSKHIADGKSAQEVESIKDMGASALTMTATASFFFAMSLYPDVQAKAREELDRVLGPGKIPRLSDRGSLPYIEAVYRELMRWHPTVPMGVPHQSTEDIIYKGYLIPKGATLSANIWAMTHDPEQFPDPYRFIPERHLRDDGKFDNINSITAYGFGRRLCVGRYVADTTLWLVIACVLATTDIYRDDGLDKSEALKGMDVEEYFTDGGLW
ncbi:cytochrome P450 [Dendrothele bispora CBS 962.96]|uniref:Cytochrome P450 n=1 Tax=Dendrothele bispora (strain CBS 962.96) TaxID=1314807 RepID=A0A4S8LPB2_DENBC|nr:cytochrome P450 [Dendrothele bispora CBS 962.96]